MNDIEKLLIELGKYGEVMLTSCADKSLLGWRCSITLDVRVDGVKASVCSGYRHPSPYAALVECWNRMGGLSSSLSIANQKEFSSLLIESKK